MKPIRNRVFCLDCKGTKMLFATEAKANNFIRFNTDEIMEETGKAPVRSYYCESCGGWHTTSNSKKGYYIEKHYQATFNWEESRKKLTAAINSLRSAYLRRNFIDCYKYIEEAYTEIEKAERANIYKSKYEADMRYLQEVANGLHKACPGYNPKLNLCIKSLDKLIEELRNAAHSSTLDFTVCEKILDAINIEIKNAIRFGAGERRLAMYRKVYAKYSSPQKIKLKMERKELYSRIVNSYRKKKYQECEEAIKLSYQNFYTSLNEGVAVQEIQQAMKRIEKFKEFVENLRKEEADEKKDR